MKESTEMLYYKRTLSFIKNMRENLCTEQYSKENVVAFYDRCLELTNNHSKFAMFDLNCFLLLCMVSLMGLNKENIEENDNLRDYKYSIDYHYGSASECFSDMKKQAESFDLPFEKKLQFFNDLNFFKDSLHNFDSARVKTTNFDEWLSVKKINDVYGENMNFLFLVRNGLMHSEYRISDLDKFYNFFLVNVTNSDYHGFEGELLLCNFAEFVKFYYSNDGYFGLVDKYLVAEAPDDFKLENDGELTKVFDISIRQVKYSNPKNCSKKTFEKTNYNKSGLQKLTSYNVIENDICITEEERKQVELLIEKYYGDEFYYLDGFKQCNIIFDMLKLLLVPANYVSEWIMHFYLNTMHTIHRDGYLDNIFKGIFAIDAVFIIMKSYLISYRIQCKAFEEIKYSFVQDFNYQYIEVSDYDMYEHFKQKLKDKGVVCSEDEYKKRYFCEIFRNSFAHGNIGFSIEKNGLGKIIDNLILTDEYKGKERKIIISLDEANKFLDSKAFARQNVFTR